MVLRVVKKERRVGNRSVFAAADNFLKFTLLMESEHLDCAVLFVVIIGKMR